MSLPAPLQHALPASTTRVFCLTDESDESTHPGLSENGLEFWVVDISDLADGDVSVLADSIREHLDVPFALVGQGRGAWMAFELCRYLERTGAPVPRALFALESGTPRPMPEPAHVSVPIVALLGTDELADDMERLEAWAAYTTAGLDFSCYPGGGHFLRDRAVEFSREVRARMM